MFTNTDNETHELEVSELAHRLALISRRHNRLLVISSGNRAPDKPGRIAPPADCEAALVVAGRSQNVLGEVGGPCEISRTAFGPELMFKPDLSWFSTHRVIGGDVVRGSSFAAPLISRLAAYCFRRVRDPSPDLVRALVLNTADLGRGKFDERLGYGTPLLFPEPWNCPSNTAIMSWTRSMAAGQVYRWPDIAVPPSMMRYGRLVGRVRLIAILDPIVERAGDEYFSTRIRTNLRHFHSTKRKWEGFLGTVKPDTYEHNARRNEQKWQPVQLVEKTYTERNGPLLGSDRLQVDGQIYWRHQDFLYDPDYLRGRQHTVTFVLTLEAPTAHHTYNEFRQLMGVQIDDLTTEIETQVQSEQ